MLPAKPFRDYTAAEVLQLASACTWPSRIYLRVKFDKHRTDWIDTTKMPLSFDQFEALHALLSAASSSSIYYYERQDGQVRFAIMADVKAWGRKYKNAGLIVDPLNRRMIGLWKVAKGERYFKRQDSWRRLR